MSEYVCVLIARVVSVHVAYTSYWSIRVMGICSLRASIGHLFTHPFHPPSPSPPPTHKHHRVCDMVSLPSCSVSQYQHSPPEQTNTTCFCQIDYSRSCPNLYLGLGGLTLCCIDVNNSCLSISFSILAV